MHIFENTSMMAADTVRVAFGDECTSATTVVETQIDVSLDTFAADVSVTSSSPIMSKYRTWEAEDAFLRGLVVIPSIAATLEATTGQWDLRAMIGVHVRTGQDPVRFAYEDIKTYTESTRQEHVRWRGASTAGVFAAEMRRILASQPAQVFFVASDTQESIDALVAEFGESIVKFYARTEFDRSKEQIVASVVDLVILGSTRELLGSNWSSFTEVAARLAGVKPRLAGIHF
jgi:hypothetical protein